MDRDAEVRDASSLTVHVASWLRGEEASYKCRATESTAVSALEMT